MTIPEIISTVAAAFGVSPEGILGEGRDNRIVIPRHTAMMMVREYCELPYEQIGGWFDRNHGTVLHGIESIKEKIQTNAKLAATVGTIRATIASAMSANARAVRTKDNRLRPALAAKAVFIGYRAWRVK